MIARLILGWFLGFLGIVSNALVWGQTTSSSTATFDGTVVNTNTRQPIVGAFVQANALPERTTVSSSRTRADGSFRLVLDPTRTYSIVTSAEGYKILEEKLAFSDQRADRIYGKEIRLEPGVSTKVQTAMPVVLPTVQFAPRRSDLLPEAQATLRRVATLLQAHPEVRIEAAGHTDTIGDIKLNRMLALDRAEAVRLFLVELGVDQSRINVQSYGGTRPLPGPLSNEARARNKRVELLIQPNQ
jgi:outer membrane protein OmpA-like peptidoglycan-associated protein